MASSLIVRQITNILERLSYYIMPSDDLGRGTQFTLSTVCLNIHKYLKD